MIWCCPLCRGSLGQESEGVRCLGCDRRYETVEGIPDLRLHRPAWIEFEDDRRRAHELVQAVASEDVQGSVEFVFRRRKGWTDELIDRRVRQVLELPGRLRGELDEWLAPLRDQSGLLLDVGCGPGTLLAAIAPSNRDALGIDVSMEWLVVAKRMIESAGGRPVLACALAETLPLPDRSVEAIAVLDVVEHVSDPSALVEEVNRVLAPGGLLVLATPNRFSLAAEPHVGVWGVGWLPVRLQERYVRWRSGKPYGFVRLLSRRELDRLFERHSDIGVRIRPAKVPGHELRAFSRRRTLLAKTFNELVSRRLLARLVSPVSPFFHLVGRRR